MKLKAAEKKLNIARHKIAEVMLADVDEELVRKLGPVVLQLKDISDWLAQKANEESQ